MPYELFVRKRTHGGPPSVSVTKNGLFVINSSAVEKHIAKSKFIHIYWDKEHGKIGLKPLTKKEDKSYSIHFSPKGNVGSLSATAFLKFIGYKTDSATKSFSAAWNDDEEMLEFTIFDKGEKPKRFPRE